MKITRVSPSIVHGPSSTVHFPLFSEGRVIIPHMKRAVLLSLLLFALFGFVLFSQEVTAAPFPQQPYSTPTPGPDGRILYIVQPGDSCIAIAERHNLTLSQLRALNNLDEACVLQPGQVLFIGIGGPALLTPTSGPTPTPPTPTVTPTPLSGTTEICVMVYEDANGDALRQETEMAVAGSAISIVDMNGMYSDNRQMPAGSDPICFKDVPASEYTINVGLPDGYNPTTQASYRLSILPGEQVAISFGAQKRITPVDTGESPAPASSTIPWLGLLGGLLLLSGLGLAWYSWRMERERRYAQRLARRKGP